MKYYFVISSVLAVASGLGINYGEKFLINNYNEKT
jgi:hypothetical protein